jgi:hypothetical protein
MNAMFIKQIGCSGQYARGDVFNSFFKTLTLPKAECARIKQTSKYISLAKEQTLLYVYIRWTFDRQNIELKGILK